MKYLLLILLSRTALAGFSYDFMIQPPVGEPKRGMVPQLAKEYGLTLPTSKFRCMLRTDEKMVEKTLTGAAELWCCPEKAPGECVLTYASCTAEKDGMALLTLAESERTEKDQPEKPPRRTTITFYCLHDGTDPTATPAARVKPPELTDRD